MVEPITEPQPAETKPAKKENGSKALKQLFVMLLFLTIGLALLIFVGDWLLQNVLGGLADTTGIGEALKTSGWLIVYGAGGLTALLGLILLFSRQKRK